MSELWQWWMNRLEMRNAERERKDRILNYYYIVSKWLNKIINREKVAAIRYIMPPTMFLSLFVLYLTFLLLKNLCELEGYE
jgi:hypothetical protein